MNKLRVFNNEQFGEIRVLEINNEPWFVGKDVASVLGYTTLQKMYKHIDDSDKIKIDPQSKQYQGLCQNRLCLESNPNVRTLLIINESGLYDAVFGSTLPSARQFKKWVTSEVLPSIRKTGGYVSNDNLFIETYLPFADDSTKILFKTTLETVRKQNELIIKQSEEIKEKEKIIDNVINDKGLFAVGDVGKVLKSYSSKMGSKKIFEYMRDKSILINAKDTNRHNLPYDAYVSHFNIKYVDIDKGYYTRTETKVYFTGKGLKWFLKKVG